MSIKSYLQAGLVAPALGYEELVWAVGEASPLARARELGTLRTHPSSAPAAAVVVVGCAEERTRQ